MMISPLLLIISALALPRAYSFQSTNLYSRQTAPFFKMKSDKSSYSLGSAPRNDDVDVVLSKSPHPYCDLPGDPSLILNTNVDLGSDKPEILKKLSALVASSLGKPESYVG